MNIALVEDDVNAANIITEYTKKFNAQYGEGLKLTRFSDAESFLAGYRHSIYSIVFMDVDLPKINGLDAARQLRYADKSIVIIFVTKMAQYAQKGYEVNALDYILKPVSYADFCLKMKKAVNVARSNKNRIVLVPSGSGFFRLSTDKIIFVEVMGHQLKYHLVEDVLEVRGTLSAVEKSLEGRGFLRCSNCYLVNSRLINSVNGYDVDVGGYVLKISHPRRRRFMEELMKIYSGGG
ncbi:MAG: LytTR family DNA-binding domain-containing protein [Clostridia bacterium]|nr:LytTR family DNA-binding domain-containing protein [Clostridia bacterium]